MFTSGFSGYAGASSSEAGLASDLVLNVYKAMGGEGSASGAAAGSIANLTPEQQGMLGTEFPPAPSAPRAATMVATDRGAAAAQPITPTLGSFMGQGSVPVGFAELLAAGGATEAAGLNIFCAIPESEFMDLLADTQVEDAPLTSLQKGAVVRYIQGIFSFCGFIPPALGAASPAPSAPAATDQPAQPQNSQTSGGHAADTVNLGATVDQSLRAVSAQLVPFAELGAYRRRYLAITGAPPPEEYLPTGEQLAALKALLDSGRVPFVDFAVWSPLGPRMAKFRKLEATAFVAGEFVTKSLDGPSSFAAWEQSWGLFSVAMVSLGAATPGSLQTYLAGMRNLVRLFPTKWGHVSSTDLVVRSERWSRIREDAEVGRPAGFNPNMPWDFVISASAFGRDGPGMSWWQTNFVLPATLGVALPTLDGMPGASASSSGGGRAPRAPPAKQPSTGIVCSNWNRRQGECQGRGPCPAGRDHVCSECGGNHRACDNHKGWGQPGSKGKGKGKGKKGKNKSTSSDAKDVA